MPGTASAAAQSVPPGLGGRNWTVIPATPKVAALTFDAGVTGGYWILKSTGGVDDFGVPWYGSLAGQVPAGQAVTAIAGA